MKAAAVLVGLCAVLAGSSCQAAVGAWVDVLPHVSVRLLVDRVKPLPGDTIGAIEIAMPDDYRTYWERPGQAGLAPVVTPRDADVLAARLVLPLPTVDVVMDSIDYVYRGRTILPVELSVAPDAEEIALHVELGICQNFCAPVALDLSVPVDEGILPSAQWEPIALALGAVPAPWPFDDPPVDGIAIDPDAGVMTISRWYQGLDLSSLIAETEDQGIVSGPAGLASGKIVVPLAGLEGTSPTHWRLLFASDSGVHTYSVRVLPKLSGRWLDPSLRQGFPHVEQSSPQPRT